MMNLPPRDKEREGGMIGIRRIRRGVQGRAGRDPCGAPRHRATRSADKTRRRLLHTVGGKVRSSTDGAERLAHATRTRPTNPLRAIAGGDALVDLIMVRFLAVVGGAVGGKLLMALDCDGGEPPRNRTENPQIKSRIRRSK
jgi:hypothetical protein